MKDKHMMAIDPDGTIRPLVIPMTLRERYAGQAMQGCLTNPEWDAGPEETAYMALRYADALIARLGKEEQS